MSVGGVTNPMNAMQQNTDVFGTILGGQMGMMNTVGVGFDPNLNFMGNPSMYMMQQQMNLFSQMGSQIPSMN